MRTAISFLVAVLVVSAPPIRPQAQTLTVLYSFSGGADGANARGLVMDKAGNLYGYTVSGGASGYGTVFKLDSSGNVTVLHSFMNTPDGASPIEAPVIDKAGNLYGITISGGSSGGGTVFKLDTSGSETVLHSFTGTPDGAFPTAGLVRDKAGNLYGGTENGGLSGDGTVFKLDVSGNETVLYSFTAGGQGNTPNGALTRDKVGNLYGTTLNGGSFGKGTVFKLDTSGNETLLHSFTLSDGAVPAAGVVRDKTGNLYGTTLYGGALSCQLEPGFGCGTVFKLDTSNKETVMHSFTGTPDGAYPVAGVVMDKAGNLYGATENGGSSGDGIIYKLDMTGKETVLHNFTNTPDGAFPTAGVVMDKAGNFYGTTLYGGSYGYGTVFKLSP